MSDPASSTARLLIAYDGSDGAASAIRAAGRLVPGAHALVVFVRAEEHVAEHAALARLALPRGTALAAAASHERGLEAHARLIVERGREIAERAGLDADVEVRAAASAWRALAHAARDGRADVIVCGTRGEGPFSRAVLGSTSSSLIHHADRPVLVIPPGGGELRGPTVIGYDESEGARAAIAVAARLFPSRPAIVVHAWSSAMQRSFTGESLAALPIPDGDEIARDIDDHLAAAARSIADEGARFATEHGLEARGMAVEGTPGPWRALAATARAEGAAVIVTGSRGRGAVRSTILGSTSSGLAHNAELPVLVVRDQ